MVEVGKELEWVGYRLKDIVFLAENTKPVEGDWEGYAVQVLRIIADCARQAESYLAVASK